MPTVTHNDNLDHARRVITSFKQKGKGNCVSIAIIKASIDVFGIGGVFGERLTGDGIHEVTTRDGISYQVTKEEIEEANAASGFELLNDAEIFNYACFCYAVMAKRAQLDGNDMVPPSKMTFALGLKSLADGERWSEGPRWLGVQFHTVPSGVKYAWQYPGCVGASPRHCFYVGYGLEDHYGIPDRIGFFEKFKVRHFYRVISKSTI